MIRRIHKGVETTAEIDQNIVCRAEATAMADQEELEDSLQEKHQVQNENDIHQTLKRGNYFLYEQVEEFPFEGQLFRNQKAFL